MIPDFIKMFPDPVDVFADKVEQHAKVLFPLFSVDLKQINPEWEGYIHMLLYNEDPYNDDRVDTFNEYCQESMIAFDVIDGKYLFKTGFEFFNLTPDWEEYFEKTKSSFNKTKQTFIDTGNLIHPHYNKPADIYEEVGGKPKWIQGDETPNDPDGNPMTFIARVYTANYTHDSNDIYLFYSHKHKLAVMLYQTT
ncbi:hypothetical protein [Niastella sp. OAS944]|uniref:hypothetical protein n=1 Tax=Niastella sp. OAS944 TaxID=2664089 RepID=UPI0034852517|nr:hypothetical protein [Chitinophagaceae bacterium OAS944]